MLCLAYYRFVNCIAAARTENAMICFDQLLPDRVAATDFIRAMRRVASSVTVVTTQGPAGCHGATVSAFCSVSAEPPQVLVCLRGDSRIAQIIGDNGSFCVNVLPDAASDVADRFAGRDDNRVADRFDGIDVDAPSAAGPVIDGSTAFGCELETYFDAGSHRIFIGRVIQVCENAAEPLAWMDGSYHRVVPHAGESVSKVTS